MNLNKKLNDPEIRLALSLYLNKKNIDKDEILEELHVCNGRAIADLVTLKKGVHCYEIKGDGDKVERIIDQDKYYQKSFLRLSLVTTDKHLEKALKLAPSHWGIMVARFSKTDDIVIKCIRRSKINQYFDKKSALLMLRKNEMLDLIPIRDKKIEQNSRDVLATLIGNVKKNRQLSREIGNILIARKSFKFPT